MPDEVEVTIKWRGQQVLAEIEAAVFAGLELAGEHLLQVSSDKAPHEEGDLARSGTVTSDEDAGKVAVAFDRVYAVRQHEELTWRHDPGKQAKYLEEPMLTERPVMLRIIAQAAKRRLGET